MLAPNPEHKEDGYEALLAKELGQWKARLDELDRSIALSTGERNRIQAKIEAAETLLGVKRAMGVKRTPDMTLKAIIGNLMTDGVRRTPGEMRDALVAQGVAEGKISSNTGNFYNSVRRLALDGVIVKEEDGRYRYTGGKKPGSDELPGL